MTERRPVWPTCEVCEQPITEDRDATLSIHPSKDAEYLAAKQEWEAQYVTKTESGGEIITGAGIFAHPDPIHWWVTHADCTPEEHDYWIDGGRFDTPAKALGWTIHLMEKSWFEHTDWRKLIYQLKLSAPIS